MTQTLYHVTPASNLPNIQRFGLFPNLGERTQQLDAEKAGVFLFTSTEAVENALGNWLGEAFEGYPDSLLLLKIELPETFELEQHVEWEKISRRNISPTHIKKIGLTEPGQTVYAAEMAISNERVCGYYSIIDGYPIISSNGNPWIIKKHTVEIMASEPL